MSEVPKVSIIIVNYNGTEDTLECLDSLKKTDYPNYEIILVDNASADASLALAKIHRDFPGVRILSLPDNKGFAAGNNAGITQALESGSDFVFLLNNDTVIKEGDFLSKLVEAAETDNHIGFAAPKIYFYNEPNSIWFNGAGISWRHGGRHYQYGEKDNDPRESGIKMSDYITGCAFLARAETIRRVGLLFEDFFMYYEDIDWSLRARRDSWKTVVVPEAHLWHKVARSSVKMGVPLNLYYHTRNALITAQRHAPWLVKILVYFWSVFYYLKQVAKLILIPSRRAAARAIMRGITNFYSGTRGRLN